MIFLLLIPQLLGDNTCGIEHCQICDDYGGCQRCDDGYSYDYVSCIPCHKTCKQCVGVEEQYCTECYDGFYLDIQGYYDEGYCRPCSADNLCSKCEQSGSHKCTECVPNYFLDKSSNKCTPCHSSCGTCSGPEETQCLTCKEGYLQINNLCKSCGDNCLVCQDEKNCKTCKDHFFPDSSNQCQKCDDTCQTCHGTSPNDCDDCIDGYFKSNNLCRQCNPNCEQCVGERDHCTQCKDGRYLDEDKHVCVDCDAKCKTCKKQGECETCADGYYRDTDCEKCDTKCATCDTFSDGYYKEVYCTTCAQGYYPEKVSYYDGAVRCQKTNLVGCLIAVGYSECQTCMQGYYKNGKKCAKCDKSCLTCNVSDKCTSCEKGFYIDDSSLCSQCPENCIDCTSGTDCKECVDGYYKDNGICKKCDDSCSSCKDGTNACIECNTGYFFNQLKRCIKCSDNCDECTNKTHCIDCASEFFIAPDGSCSPCADVCFECKGPTADDCIACDPGYYLSKSLKKCFKCHEACSVCDGPNDYDCSKCAPGYFLNKDMDIAPGKQGDICTKCESGCKTCTSPKDCTECHEGFYFTDGNCEHCVLGCKNCSAGVHKCTECFEGYYISSTDGTLVNCSRCPAGCDSCSKDGSGKLTCNTCFDGYYPKDNRCIKCTSPCATCTSETECKSCINGHLLVGTSCSSQCSSSCASCENAADSCTGCNDGYILNGTICLQCPDDCKTCEFEDDSSVCTSCFEGFYLANGKCKACYYECATCFDNSRYCYSCKEGYYKYTQNEYYYGFCQECYLGTPNCTKCTSDFPEGTVVFTCLECENGFFLKDNTCQKCHSSCKTCDGTTEQNCLTCNDEFFFVDGKCLSCSDSCLTCSTSPTTCASCRSHQYLENGKCFDCSNSCAECKDANTCTKCPENKFLHEGKCLDSCLEVGEGWGDNGNHECVKCNLENCNKFDNSCKCQSCNDGYHLVSDSLTSVQLCLPCKLDNCKTCTGSELNDCTDCMHGYELKTDETTNEKTCHKICDDGYFFNSSKECEKCLSPCKICSGIDGSICQECEDGYFLENNKCSSFPIDCEQNKHCENENKGDKPVQITIDISKFESFKNEQSGGALRIVNCGLKGEGNKFNDCTSEKGGGGAIFVFNDKNIDQPISFKQMEFTSCKAAYGGAVYIYSISESKVSVESCIFRNNDVHPSSSKLTGGSAIYLTVKNGAVTGCSFIRKQKSSAGMIKVTEDFEEKPERLTILHHYRNEKLNSVVITECSFEINSNSSFVYVVDKQTALGVEEHHIAKGVKLTEDKKDELNRKFIEFNLNDDEKANNKKESVLYKNYLVDILMMISLFALIVLIATIIIISKKKSQFEMSNESIDSFNA